MHPDTYSRAPAAAPPRGRARPRDVFDGARCLFRGIGIVFADPSLWLLGLLPALIAVIVLLALLLAFLFSLATVTAALTPFAGGWDPAQRDGFRLLLGIVLAIGAGWLALISYAALAIGIGQPFYEAISRRVDAREGGPPPATVEVAWWRAMGRALRDGLLLVALTAALGIVLFALGFLPVIGQTVLPVFNACVAGFLLAVELTSVALERRGHALRDRVRLLWRRKLLTLGFGVATFLVFLIPLGAVIAMPGAVAGGTLLTRRIT